MYFIEVRYPERGEELEVIRRTTGKARVELQPVLHRDDVLAIQSLVREIPIASHLLEYALDIVRATRRERGREGDVAPDFVRKYVEWGAGPRAAQYLVLGAKAQAWMSGRTHVTADDLRSVAYPVLTHRIIVNFAAVSEGIRSTDIIDRLLGLVKVKESGTP